jgi:glutathione synthase/RimK-type ligase-like ATP-grasp enzyme
MKVYFMLAYARGSGASNPAIAEAIERLRARGLDVDVGVAEDIVLRPEDPGLSADLFVLKSHTPFWLSVAAILHAQGARIVNPYPACQVAQDKIVSTQRLAAADVRTPRSWVTGDLARLLDVAEQHPLIVKPSIGGRGAGIQIVHNARELAAVPPPSHAVLVQEYVREGEEVKLYVVGDAVSGVVKRYEQRGFVRSACAVDDVVREVALRCGRALGLGIYGVDAILTRDGPVVIDVNYFPSFKGAAFAGERIAAYVAAHLGGS